MFFKILSEKSLINIILDEDLSLLESLFMLFIYIGLIITVTIMYLFVQIRQSLIKK